MNRHFCQLLCCILCVSLGGRALGQCEGAQLETLLEVDFEAGIPDDWTLASPSDGGSWRINPDRIGYYSNPGSGQWLYVNDEQANAIGRAVVTLPEWDVYAFRGYLFLEMDLLFQSFADSGWMELQVWQNGQWITWHRQTEDLSGRLQFDLSHWTADRLQVRLVYDDEGSWGWGMGIDNVLLYGKVNTCGNGRCELGEDPSTCPGDCAGLPDPAPYWVSAGTDLYGQSVSYRQLDGGTRCDDCAEAISLGFDFLFYNQSYRTLYLNSNGNLTLKDEYVSYTPEAFCLNGPSMIAPFFADADLGSGGRISYYQDPEGHYIIVQWESVGYFGCEANCGLRNTFQAILTDGSIRRINNQDVTLGVNVIFSYGDMQWTGATSTGSSNGFRGSPATVGLNEGNGVLCEDYGTFDDDTYRYHGYTQDDACPPNGVHHLDHRSILLNAQSGEVNVAIEAPPILLNSTPQEKGLLLKWTLADPDQKMKQILQRSTDSTRFIKLGDFDGTTGQIEYLGASQYCYLDRIPFAGTSYYRLLVIRSDSQYSEVLTVSYTPLKTNGVEILSYGPNPCTDQLTISLALPDVQPITVLLSDMKGIPLLQEDQLPFSNDHQFSIPTRQLSPGNYLLAIHHPTGQQAIQFVKR